MTSRSTEGSFTKAVGRLHAAMAKVANGDTSAIKELYVHSADATSFYGWGGYEKGWDEVSRRWDWAGQQFKGGTVSYESISSVVGADLAYITDIETFKVKVAEMDEPTQWSNRVTHIFRLEGEVWLLVHRHANRLEGQYQPAPRLAASSTRQ